MNVANDRHMWVMSVPYKVGITTGISFGFGCVPVIFHRYQPPMRQQLSIDSILHSFLLNRNSAMWFNERFVHEDLPDGGIEALDTVFKVSTEPIMHDNSPINSEISWTDRLAGGLGTGWNLSWEPLALSS